MKEIVRNTYDKIAARYAAQRAAFDNTRHLEKLASLLAPNATVLDLGCGSGVPVDSFLISRGFNVVGIDLSERQIELARFNVPAAEYFVRDMSELKVGEFVVDAIVSFYAIFHIPRATHGRLFETLNSCLRPGGSLLVTMATAEWEGLSTYLGEPMFESHYGSATNIELVKSAGFDVVVDEIDRTGGEAHQIILGKKKQSTGRASL